MPAKDKRVVGKPTDDDEFTTKEQLLHYYSLWIVQLSSHKPNAIEMSHARNTLLQHAAAHRFIDPSEDAQFNMLLIKHHILNGFDGEIDAECMKHLIRSKPYISTCKLFARNPSCAYLVASLVDYCTSNNVSTNLVERALRKLNHRNLIHDQQQLFKMASSASKLKHFVDELNNKD